MFNLQDPRFFKAFMDVINPMRYDESHFKYYKNLKISSLVESGIKTYVTYRMSRGGIGKDFSSAFNRTRGGRPEKINSWETMKEELPLIHMRLQDIHISNKDALNLIADSKFNQSNVLQYLDPPYLPDTRVTKSVYRHEFTEQNHIDLAKICNQSKAKIIISGYPSKLYNKLYHGWNVVVKECKNNSGQNKIKNMRKEILWMNF
jgi:DNA adenine methylase